jgi:carbon-monoxide dehydrogenase medium subunit
MKPARFAYEAPTELDAALALLGDDLVDARVIAGGQSLVPMMNFRLAVPELLVDLNRIAALRYVRVDGGTLRIGAGARQAELLRDPAIEAGWPLLTAGVRHIGHPQIRSRGTVCGSLAHHDPVAELPALAVALDATKTVANRSGGRQIPAADFFVSSSESDVQPGEILVEAAFPPVPAGTGWGFREIARRRGDFALVGAAGLVRAGADGRVAAARLVLFGVAERPLRATAAEQALVGSDAGADVRAQVRELVAEAVDPVADGHATAEYRREAAAHLAAEVAADAWGRTGTAHAGAQPDDDSRGVVE